jgi:hypothetical protein
MDPRGQGTFFLFLVQSSHRTFIVARPHNFIIIVPRRGYNASSSLLGAVLPCTLTSEDTVPHKNFLDFLCALIQHVAVALVVFAKLFNQFK